jgi:mRNA interferase MazF
MAAFRPGDIVVVPFPFTERLASKRRPALVCSSAEYNEESRHVVLAMITTASHSEWPGDVPIRELAPTGLPVPSVVRWKLFTLDASRILRRAGALAAADRAQCAAHQPIAL